MSLRDAAQQALEALKLARLNGKNGLYPGELEEVAATIAALEAALAEPQPEIEQLKAERDALKAAAEKGTEYVLAQINQDLRTERDALLVEVERLKGVNYDLVKQLMVLQATKQLTAAIDAARSKT